MRVLFTTLFFTFHFSLFTSFAQQAKDYVDPRIGSEGLGRTYIGPCVPFGMIKPGPDCGTSNNAGWAPLPAAVSGFSQTHVSGTGGGPKYGNILIQPYSSTPQPQHRTEEEIRLGYYSCTYQESGIKTEITSARRASLYRFTFPKDSAQHIYIDLSHFLGRSPIPHAREAQQFEGAHLDSTAHFTTVTQQDGTTHQNTTYTYSGYQTISGGWNNGKPYTVYFYIHTAPSPAPSQGKGVLMAKVAISFISEEQARLNCEADLPDWDFEATYQRCIDEWQTLLCRLPIQDTATDQVKRMYYTALYHMCLMPTDRTEDNPSLTSPKGRSLDTTEGKLPLPYGGGREGAVYYDDYYAIWDTYRTSTPLLTLLCPERATAIARSLLTIYQRDGFLPDARSGNSNGRTQGGSNAEIVLCDALARGLDIDARLALEAMLKDATVPPADDEAEGRGGLEEYNKYGYIPYIVQSSESIVHSLQDQAKEKRTGQSTMNYELSTMNWNRIARAGNRTLEYAFDDWAIEQVMKYCDEHRNDSIQRQYDSLHLNDSVLQRYRQLFVTTPSPLGGGLGRGADRWKNLWRSDFEHDGCRGFIMPRDDQGNWLDSLPYGHSQLQPLKFRYTPDVSYEGPWYCKWWDCFMYEASSWEYSFSVPHDIPGLIEACGGPAAFEARLDTFFAHGYYNVANEPSFLTPCLYCFIGKKDKSIRLIRKIIEENFSDRPDGIPGNDDGGAMSSWLACHLLGRYPLAGTNEWIKLEPIDDLNNDLSNDLSPASPKGRSSDTSSIDNVGKEAPPLRGFCPPITGELKGEWGGVAVFYLHGQKRRFDISFTEQKDSIRLDWSIVRNLKTWHGSYSMTPKARKKATQLSYEQPLDGQYLTLNDSEMFLSLSQEAYRQLKKKGTCTYSNTPWKIVASPDHTAKSTTSTHLSDTTSTHSSDATSTLSSVVSPLGGTGGLPSSGDFLCAQSSEGATMWVLDTPELPLIIKMENNPVEIDWEIMLDDKENAKK